jgi:methanethiol S-methyltransferase
MKPDLFKRVLILLYGVASYTLFLATFLYAIGFIGNLWVPKSMDSTPTMAFLPSLLVNLGLLSLFAIQHSVMARPAFKRWWTRIIPASAERSTYTLFSSLALIALFAFWQPLGGVVWAVDEPFVRGMLYGLYGLGWLLVLVATFQINHFDLFGLRQVWLQFRGQPYRPLPFRLPALYRLVRHPLYVGWFVVFWATPSMTVAHLLFAMVTSAYILLAIGWEERDLMDAHPEYQAYREDVPMLVPGFGRRPRSGLLPD